MCEEQQSIRCTVCSRIHSIDELVHHDPLRHCHFSGRFTQLYVWCEPCKAVLLDPYMRGAQLLVSVGLLDREARAADGNFFQVITPRITSCNLIRIKNCVIVVKTTLALVSITTNVHIV